MSEQPIHLLIIHDPTQARDHLVHSLKGLAKHPVIETADTLSEGMSQIFYKQPDLILIQWLVSDNDGIRSMADMHHFIPHIPIAVWIEKPSVELKTLLLEQGVLACLDPCDLIQDATQECLRLCIRLNKSRLEEIRLRDQLNALKLESAFLVEKRTEELAASKAEIEKNLKVRTRFLNTVALEIRKPVEEIHLQTEHLLNQPVPDFVLPQVIHIRNAANQIVGFFDNTLDLTLLKTDGIELTPSSFPLETLASELIGYVRKCLYVRQADFKAACSPHISKFVIGDHYYLFKALRNVADVALRHCQKGILSLTFKLLPANKFTTKLVVEISFSGPEISTQELQCLSPDFHLDPRLKPHYFKGIALNLAIASVIIHAMNGTLTHIFSSAVDQTFQCEIPLQLDPSSFPSTQEKDQ